MSKEARLNSYCKGIWKARYFWIHLALSDLRVKWRRSVIGIFWSILQPLGMTFLLSLVFSRLFHTNVILFLPYILSGLITWEFIASSLTAGSSAFVQADAYIKQIKHPLAIYTLRIVASNLITLALGSIVLWIWAGYVTPHHINSSWLAILSFFPLIAMITWPLATILAYFGARFRDIPHAMGLILQASWFISPIYFEAEMFRKGGLDVLIDYNPLYHLLQIIRLPILEGHWPTSHNYLFCLGTMVCFMMLAIIVGRRAEPKVIFCL